MSKALFTLIIATASLPAALIASNYTGTTSGGFGLTATGARAAQFTAGFTGFVTDVQVWISAQGTSGNATLDTYLLADNGGLPGAVLEHIGGIPGNLSTSFALATGAAAGTTLLTAGTKYWIGGVSLAGTSRAIAWGSGGTAGPEAFTTSGSVNGLWTSAGTNNDAVQYIINGNAVTSAVPEPASFVIVEAALLVLGLRVRK